MAGRLHTRSGKSVIAAGDPVALLVTVTVPLSLPAAVGLKITLNEKVWFGVSVTGVPAPLRLKPAPLSVMPEICTFAFPVFLTVTVCVEEEPSFTFP